MKWLDLLGIRDCGKGRSKCTDRAMFLSFDLILCTPHPRAPPFFLMLALAVSNKKVEDSVSPYGWYSRLI